MLRRLHRKLLNCNTVADLRGVSPAPPKRYPILSFSYTFLPKSTRVGGRRPLNGKSWIRSCNKWSFNVNMAYQSIYLPKSLSINRFISDPTVPRSFLKDTDEDSFCYDTQGYTCSVVYRTSVTLAVFMYVY